MSLSLLSDASGMLRSVTQFSHLIADTIVNGAGAAHTAPTDQADRECLNDTEFCFIFCLMLYYFYISYCSVVQFTAEKFDALDVLV